MNDASLARRPLPTKQSVETRYEASSRHIRARWPALPVQELNPPDTETELENPRPRP
jgi:hypothetical protein